MCPNCFAMISFSQDRICLVCNRASYDGLTHPKCRGKHVIDGSFTSIDYKGTVKKLLYTFKYKPYVSSLKVLLADLFYEGLIQQEGFMRALSTNPVLIPIPLHVTRLRQRGYNQSEILAIELGKKFDLPIENLLTRTKKTISQFGLKREARIENVKGAFCARSKKLEARSYQGIFLIDDIMTSGSTFLECAYVLKKAGVKRVWGMALARD